MITDTHKEILSRGASTWTNQEAIEIEKLVKNYGYETIRAELIKAREANNESNPSSNDDVSTNAGSGTSDAMPSVQ